MDSLVKSLFEDTNGISSESYDELIHYLNQMEDDDLLEWVYDNVVCTDDRYHSI